ncbi:CHAT domain-containing protein [Streptomyces sp. NBC_00343]|uniref:CHAT domain-containing protein n=1 Tax=Streptomyces sp. NBC_00343 TaxID=2975719 RepID=UPI002E2A6CD9|nr:CHAT domain-containing protein [Streptomyces sp. NBC_00343]
MSDGTESALRAVLDRVLRADDDPAGVLGEDTVEEVRRLGPLTTDDDLDGAFVLGSFHWCRYQLLETDDEAAERGDGQRDLEAAAYWFGRLLPYAPGRVPRQLREFLAPQLPPAGAGPPAWNSEAARYLMLGPGSGAVLDRAVTLLRQAVAAADPAGLPEYLSNLSVALQMRFELHDARDDLDDAVTAATRAAEAAASDHPRRIAIVSNLSNSLRVRYDHFGAAEDIAAAVTWARQAVAATSDDLDRPACVSNLALALQARYGTTGVRADLDEAIALGRESVAATPGNVRKRPARMTNLANSLRVRFERSGAVADLDEAIALISEAARRLPPDDPERADILSSHSNALRTRYARDARTADIEQAVDLAREALDATGPTDRRSAGQLANLSWALRARSERTGSREDAAEAVRVARRAVDLVDPGSPARPVAMSGYSLALLRRFELSDDIDDLTAAVDTGARAAEALPAGHQELGQCLGNLCHAYRLRFERLGEPNDLQHAVSAGERALTELAEGDQRRVAAHGNLANALQTRHEFTGALEDLDRSIAHTREAALLTTPDSRGRALFLSNLCGAHFMRHTRSQELADLDAAVEAGRNALTIMPDDHAARATVLSNVSNAEHRRFRVTERVEHLTRAVLLTEQAVAATSDDHTDRGRFLSNLGALLMTRRDHLSEEADLDRAVAVCRAAATATPRDHPYRAGRLGNLGAALETAYDRDGDSAALEEALGALREGAAITTAPTLERARAGAAQARLAGRIGRWDEAVQAWSQVLDFLPLLVDRRLLRADRQYHLSVLRNLGPDAAIARIRLGDTDGAWSVLEQGRGVLLGQGFETRSGVGLLAARQPALHARFIRLRTVLNADEGSTLTDPEGRRTAAEQWRDLLAEIRRSRGFERFGMPPDIRQLRRAAVGGVVIAPLATRAGSHALILTPGHTEAITLEDVTHGELLERANAFLAASQGRSTLAGNADRTATLGWLWDRVAEPILRHLGKVPKTDDGQRLPRVWWLPTGAFSVLPLHAAGHYGTVGRRSGRSVLDRVVSSYTPTVRALQHAVQRTAAAPPSADRALVVGVGAAAGFPPLPWAVEEAVAVAGLLRTPTPLLDTAATREAVIRRLPDSTWAHFACHAATDPLDPSAGHLVLHDGRLAVREVMALQNDNARLAYLSACTTAFGGTSLLDESIHVTSAMQLAGFAHVIGTLWPVSDDISRRIAQTVHSGIAAGEHPSAALHTAVDSVRKSYPANPYLWASHVHYGP